MPHYVCWIFIVGYRELVTIIHDALTICLSFKLMFKEMQQCIIVEIFQDGSECYEMRFTIVARCFAFVNEKVRYYAI
eukprot:m.146594 g.146594  ORF g.146594 m.146594 type:complete len:77 (+) comp16091_c0_seq1:188-418(+)